MQTGHNIRKNRSGYWEIRFSEQLPDGRWRSRSVSTGTADRSEAVRFKDEFLNHSARLSSVGVKPKLLDVIEAYETAKPGQEFIVRNLKRGLGHLPVDLVTSEEVARYRAAREASGLAAGTVRRELTALGAALNWAAKTKFLNGSVKREDLPWIDKPAGGTPRVLWLNEEQEAEFHALAMGLSIGRKRLHRLTLFVGIGLDTAARKEAIEDLTWDRVDFVMGRIDFRVPGKRTGNKRRTVVEISRRLRPLLERARDEWLARGAPAGEPVVGSGSVRKAWERWVGSAGFAYPWMTPHLMRHSWARLNVRAGVSLFDVAAVLGDRYETVARNYLHDCPGNSGVVNRRW